MRLLRDLSRRDLEALLRRHYCYAIVGHKGGHPRLTTTVSVATGQQFDTARRVGSAATQPDLAIEEFPRKVQMAGVSHRLLDHVQHDPTNTWRLVSPILAPGRETTRSPLDALRTGALASQCCPQPMDGILGTERLGDPMTPDLMLLPYASSARRGKPSPATARRRARLGYLGLLAASTVW